MDNKMKIFCIPHAGGSLSNYVKFKKVCSQHVEIIPIELAGRGMRLREAFYQSIREAAEDVAGLIWRQLSGNEKFAVWGHSMGGNIAYEASCILEETSGYLPGLLFISGCNPPQTKVKADRVSSYPEKEFLDKIKKLGGISKEILEDRETLTFFLRILRSDFKINEEYCVSEIIRKLDSKIILMNGREDHSVSFLLEEWQQYSTQCVEQYMFDGDHFFINNHCERIIRFMEKMSMDLFLKI